MGSLFTLLSPGKIVQLESNNQDGYALLGKKIYAMVNDFQGGMWIGTDKGIFITPYLVSSLLGIRRKHYLTTEVKHRSVK